MVTNFLEFFSLLAVLTLGGFVYFLDNGFLFATIHPNELVHIVKKAYFFTAFLAILVSIVTIFFFREFSKKMHFPTYLYYFEL